jgi:hypothetical protein
VEEEVEEEYSAVAVAVVKMTSTVMRMSMHLGPFLAMVMVVVWAFPSKAVLVYWLMWGSCQNRRANFAPALVLPPQAQALALPPLALALAPPALP